MMQIYADYHTHTRYSHGRGTVEENIRAGIAKGLEAVAISDHGPAGIGIGIRNADTLQEIQQEVEACKEKYPVIRPLTGVEANVISLDGALDVPEARLQELDIVMAGLHWQIIAASLQDQAGLVFGNILGRYSRRAAAKARVANTKALVEAVNRYKIDVITHPGLKMSIDTKELACAAAKRGTALEINASHGRMTPEYVRVGLQEGVKFAIGSDAHRPERVGEFDRALQIAAAAELTAEEIINAREVREPVLMR